MASAFNHCDFYSGNPFEEICVFWWDDGIQDDPKITNKGGLGFIAASRS